jgi:hypothetical protein
MARPEIDQVVLGDYGFVPSNNDTPRLTFLLPRILPSATFGGVTTGFKIFLDLARRLREAGKWDLRLIFDSGYPAEVRDVLRIAVGSKSEIFEGTDITFKGSPSASDTRRSDFFVCYNWWTALNALALVRAQQEHFGGNRRPLIHIIQDYEPLFYPMSSAHMLARAAFDSDWPVWGIFNSSQLHDYFRLQGHSLAREVVIEPALHEKLLPYLGKLDASRKEKTILIYGRGLEARNCFSLVKAGLEKWSRDYPLGSDWRVRSLGSPHLPIRLADGRMVESEGKRSLDEYAAILLTSAVGVSLMASPHPSYPPLEMAHFGIRTITNSFTCKDLGAAHDNIVSLRSLHPAAIAEAIASACRAFEATPGAGLSARSHMTGYLNGFDLSVLQELSDAVAGFVGDA